MKSTKKVSTKGKKTAARKTTKKSARVSQKGREAALGPTPAETGTTESEASALDSSNSPGNLDNMGDDNVRIE
jgi:hypothetical protein